MAEIRITAKAICPVCGQVLFHASAHIENEALLPVGAHIYDHLSQVHGMRLEQIVSAAFIKISEGKDG